MYTLFLHHFSVIQEASNHHGITAEAIFGVPKVLSERIQGKCTKQAATTIWPGDER